MLILDFNHCTIKGCQCGWNITLSGYDEKELGELKKLIRKIKVVQDVTNYSVKINKGKF